MRALLALLFLLPTAMAGPVPAVHFLGGEAMGEGSLSQDIPEGNESTQRILGPAALWPAQEFRGSDILEDRLSGRVVAALWLDAPIGESGDLNVSLYADGAEIVQLAYGLAPVAGGDPLSIVPGDPSDPESALGHVMAAVAASGTSPIVVDLGFIDAQIPANASLRLAVAYEPELPVGAATLSYDSLLAPSFVYLPWMAPDPAPVQGPAPQPVAAPQPGPSQAPEPAPASPSASPSQPGAGSSAQDDEPEKSKESPMWPATVLVAVFGAAMLMRRR